MSRKKRKPKSGYRITVDDFLKANRKASREEEIAARQADIIPHPAPQVRQGLRQEEASEGDGEWVNQGLTIALGVLHPFGYHANQFLQFYTRSGTI